MTLYLVGTPIGNLEDITRRAERILQEVDFIAAEDTRVSGKLLHYFGIQKPMVSYHEHNRAMRGPEIVQRILQGETCALMTDAGMPAISDPGEDLARLCHEAGIPVVPVPGACAAVCALAQSGFPSGKWCFEGFLPVQNKAKRERLEVLNAEPRTAILYEAPHRLRATLADLRDALGDERKISISRELTKIHEECLSFTLKQAVEYYQQHEPRGEFVLVLAGAQPVELSEEDQLEQAMKRVDALLADGLSQKDAIKQAAKEMGVRKNRLYQQVLEQE